MSKCISCRNIVEDASGRLVCGRCATGAKLPPAQKDPPPSLHPGLENPSDYDRAFAGARQFIKDRFEDDSVSCSEDGLDTLAEILLEDLRDYDDDIAEFKRYPVED